MVKRTFVDNNNLKYYFNNIKEYNVLTQEEEINLSKKIKNGDKKAFNTMVKANLKLVVRIAKSYVVPEWNLDDLIQEGNLGLLKAVERFDHTYNVRFSTYGAFWIKQAIMRAITNKRRQIRLPHRKEEKLKEINNAIKILSENFNKKPSALDIADYLGCKEADVLNLRAITEVMMSIDNDINDEGCTLLNTIEDSRFSPGETVTENEMITETDKVLAMLKEKEKFILKERFAFEGNGRETLRNIANRLGVSPETVRQIEIKAINKIKNDYGYLKEFIYPS